MRALPSPGPSRRGEGRRSRRLTPWLFLAPALFFGAVFYAGPILVSLWLSLTDWNPLGVPRWRGLGNYVVLFTQDATFWRSLANTLVFALGSAAIGIPAALALALAVAGSRGRAAWRTLFWLPSITNVVAVGYAWQYVLDPAYGLVNRALGLLGISGPAWLTQPGTAMLSVAGVMAWMTLGHNMLLFAAGLEAIDPALLDAARIDGTTTWQRLRYVVLPLLRPTLLFVAVTTLISGMGYFALILVMTEGGPDDATMVSALYMYRMAFEQLRMGRASAVAFVLLAVTLLLALLQFRLAGPDAQAA